MSLLLQKDFSGGQVDDRHPSRLTPNQFARLRDISLSRGTARRRHGFEPMAAKNAVPQACLSNFPPPWIKGRYLGSAVGFGAAQALAMGVQIPRGSGAASTRWDLLKNWTLAFTTKPLGFLAGDTSSWILFSIPISGDVTTPANSCLTVLWSSSIGSRTGQIRVIGKTTTSTIDVTFATVFNVEQAYSILISRGGTNGDTLSLYVDRNFSASQGSLPQEDHTAGTTDIYCFQVPASNTYVSLTSRGDPWGLLGELQLWNANYTTLSDEGWDIALWMGRHLSPTLAAKASLTAYYPMDEGHRRILQSGIDSTHPSYSTYNVRGFVYGKPGFSTASAPDGASGSMLLTGHGGVAIPEGKNHTRFFNAHNTTGATAPGWSWVTEFRPADAQMGKILLGYGAYGATSSGSNQNRSFGLQYDESTSLFKWIYENSTGSASTGQSLTTYAQDGTRYQVALVASLPSTAMTLQLYVNGTLDRTFSGIPWIGIGGAAGKQRMIGCEIGYGGQTVVRAGVIGECGNVSFWRGQLSKDELNAIRNRVLVGDEISDPDLIGYYPLIDPAGQMMHSSVIDFSSLQEHGYIESALHQKFIADVTEINEAGDPLEGGLMVTEPYLLKGASRVIDFSPPGLEGTSPDRLLITGGSIMQVQETTGTSHRWLGWVGGARAQEDHKGSFVSYGGRMIVASPDAVFFYNGVAGTGRSGSSTNPVMQKPKVPLRIVSSSATLETGVSRYRYTYVDEREGIETPASEYVEFTGDGTQNRVLLPRPWRSRYPIIRLYRTTIEASSSAVVENYYKLVDVRVEDQVGPTAISYYDGVADTTLINGNVTLDLERFEVRGCNAVGVYLDRVVYIGLAGSRTALVMSDAGRPEVIHNSTFRNLPSRMGGELVHGLSFLGRFVVWARNSLFEIAGDPPSSDAVVVVSNDVGCDAPDSIVEFEGALYWYWRDGFYRYDGQSVQKMSRLIDGTIQGRTYTSQTGTIPSLNFLKSKNVVGFADVQARRLFWWIPQDNANIVNGVSSSNTMLASAVMAQEIPDGSFAWTTISLPVVSAGSTLGSSTSEHRITVVDPWGTIWRERKDQWYDSASGLAFSDLSGTVGLVLSQSGMLLTVNSADPFPTALTGAVMGRGVRIALETTSGGGGAATIYYRRGLFLAATTKIYLDRPVTVAGGESLSRWTLGAAPYSLRTGIMDFEAPQIRKRLASVRLQTPRPIAGSDVGVVLVSDEEGASTVSTATSAVGSIRVTPGILDPEVGYSFQVQIDSDLQPGRDLEILGLFYDWDPA